MIPATSVVAAAAAVAGLGGDGLGVVKLVEKQKRGRSPRGGQVKAVPLQLKRKTDIIIPSSSWGFIKGNSVFSSHVGY